MERPERSASRAFRRWVRYRLVLPLLRTHHPPQHTARGVSVGLAVGLTPTVGLQIPIVLLVWAAVRRWRRGWDFNPVLAGVWTLVSNVVTVPPLYYLYVTTGRLVLGRWDRVRGFETFAGRLGEHLPPDAGWSDHFLAWAESVVAEFGLPILVGCVPWTILGAWLGYRGSLRLVIRYRARRLARRRRRRRGSPALP